MGLVVALGGLLAWLIAAIVAGTILYFTAGRVLFTSDTEKPRWGLIAVALSGAVLSISIAVVLARIPAHPLTPTGDLSSIVDPIAILLGTPLVIGVAALLFGGFIASVSPPSGGRVANTLKSIGVGALLAVPLYPIAGKIVFAVVFE